jgi:hypothetical protein
MNEEDARVNDIKILSRRSTHFNTYYGLSRQRGDEEDFVEFNNNTSRLASLASSLHFLSRSSSSNSRHQLLQIVSQG